MEKLITLKEKKVPRLYLGYTPLKIYIKAGTHVKQQAPKET